MFCYVIILIWSQNNVVQWDWKIEAFWNDLPTRGYWGGQDVSIFFQLKWDIYICLAWIFNPLFGYKCFLLHSFRFKTDLNLSKMAVYWAQYRLSLHSTDEAFVAFYVKDMTLPIYHFQNMMLVCLVMVPSRCCKNAVTWKIDWYVIMLWNQAFNLTLKTVHKRTNLGGPCL